MSTSDGISPSPQNSPHPSLESYFEEGEIEVCVLLSLLLNVFLFLFASERRRTNKTWLVILISSASFLADWVAPYTIGLISAKIKFQKVSCRNSRDRNSCVASYMITNWEYPLWASFLLLHLGRLDNVTSFSAEENDMWLQQLVRLISQSASTILIFVHLPAECASSFALFFVGMVIHLCRINSLYFRRPGGLLEESTRAKLQAGSDFQTLSRRERAMRKANVPIRVQTVQLPPKKFKPRAPSLLDGELVFDTTDDRLDEKSLVQFALCFYNNFKGLFFGGAVSYSHEQRQFTRNFFLNRSSHDAFKLAEIELGFIHYDNPLLRMITIFFIFLANLMMDPSQSSTRDIGISYALFCGALIGEIFSFVMALLSSRNIVACDIYDLVKPLADAMVKRRKWSESFSKCNFICYCLHCRTPGQATLGRYIAEYLYIGPALEAWKLKKRATSDPVSESLKDKIFTELKMRSQLAQTIEIATKICSQRGDWTLIQKSCYGQLKWSIGDVEYGHSFLLWLIATNLVCHSPDPEGCDQDADRQFCEDISEYLLYLYLAKPTILAPAAGNSLKVFQDTVLEAKDFFRIRSITDHAEACQAILSLNADIKPIILKRYESESVLFDACRLAKQLLVFKEDKRWSLMSGVWMELLTYAAFHSKGTDHTPSQGGELLTFIWLLMIHLGLGKQFEEEPARTAYRIIVGK